MTAPCQSLCETPQARLPQSNRLGPCLREAPPTVPIVRAREAAKSVRARAFAPAVRQHRRQNTKPVHHAISITAQSVRASRRCQAVPLPRQRHCDEWQSHPYSLQQRQAAGSGEALHAPEPSHKERLFSKKSAPRPNSNILAGHPQAPVRQKQSPCLVCFRSET